MKSLKRAIPFFALLLLASHHAHADGSITSELRSVPEFRAIDLAGTLEVEVTIGKPARVEVRGETDLLGRVITTVKNGVLIIDTKESKHLHNNHLHVTITAPDLSSLALSGTGGLKVTGIANDSLAISLSGTGTIKATGSTGSLRAVLDGTGDIAAKDLAARDATAEVNGTGSAQLQATQSVDARLTGTGNISVHGHPARVKKSVTGLGNVSIR